MINIYADCVKSQYFIMFKLLEPQCRRDLRKDIKTRKVHLIVHDPDPERILGVVGTTDEEGICGFIAMSVSDVLDLFIPNGPHMKTSDVEKIAFPINRTDAQRDAVLKSSFTRSDIYGGSCCMKWAQPAVAKVKIDYLKTLDENEFVLLVLYQWKYKIFDVDIGFTGALKTGESWLDGCKREVGEELGAELISEPTAILKRPLWACCKTHVFYSTK